MAENAESLSYRQPTVGKDHAFIEFAVTDGVAPNIQRWRLDLELVKKPLLPLGWEVTNVGRQEMNGGKAA